jgi:hypothetical protein
MCRTISRKSAHFSISREISPWRDASHRPINLRAKLRRGPGTFRAQRIWTVRSATDSHPIISLCATLCCRLVVVLPEPKAERAQTPTARTHRPLPSSFSSSPRWGRRRSTRTSSSRPSSRRSARPSATTKSSGLPLPLPSLPWWCHFVANPFVSWYRFRSRPFRGALLHHVRPIGCSSSWNAEC